MQILDIVRFTTRAVRTRGVFYTLRANPSRIEVFTGGTFIIGAFVAVLPLFTALVACGLTRPAARVRRIGIVKLVPGAFD
jgi:hypothetical protein